MLAWSLSFPRELPAQQPNLPPGGAGVRITFLPPPLEGTLSAGVYTGDGKLVRTLASEATERDFTVGLNGLITQWDGKDDAGKALAPGKYLVRGYSVGKIDVQGVAFHGNEWLTEDEALPRIVDILAMEMDGGELLLVGRGLGPQDCIIHLARASAKMRFEPFNRQALTSGSKEPPLGSPAAKALAKKAVSAEATGKTSAAGRGGTLWSIEPIPGDATTRRKVLQRSADGSEILRELDFQADEPQPTAIVAAPDRDEIYLLERDATEIRVRGLRLKKTEKDSGGKAVSEWELFVSKSIRLFPTVDRLPGDLGRTPPARPQEKVRVSLVANDLLPAAPAAVQLAVSFDGKGSFLRTVDGLPLRRITDTPYLRWATFATEADDSVSVFQSDGAVVEEYRLRHLDQMMAFEAGEYEVGPPK